MKKTILILVLSIGIMSCSKNDNNDLDYISTWGKLNNIPFQGLEDVKFYNNNFGLICGIYGTLLKTENGGESWEEVIVGSNNSLVETFILNENEFFNSRLGLYKTNDNGNSFSELGDFSSQEATISSIHFFDSNLGLILKGGNVHKTTDGGQTWDITYNDGEYKNKMQFVSNNVGFISGGISYDYLSSGEFHKSIDGGNNWDQINITTSQITSMYFLNEQIGFISTFKDKFLKTQDGGLHWETIGDSPITFYDILFIDSNLGYGIGRNNIYKTEDGAITWINDYEDYESENLVFTSITKTPNGKLFAVTNEGDILKK